jgi:hypothetical protein
MTFLFRADGLSYAAGWGGGTGLVDGSAWNRYSIGKMLAGTDKTRRTERSRNLFYVCCSRAQRDLAVVFVNDLPKGAESGSVKRTV